MKKYFALLIIILVPFMADAVAQRAQKDSLASINGKIYDRGAEDFGNATFHPNMRASTARSMIGVRRISETPHSIRTYSL